MEQKQADALVMLNNSKLAPEYIESIREQLLNYDYASASLIFGNLKDPTTVLIISVLFGGLGIDRFMIGDFVLGIGKLLFGILTGIFTCGLLSWIWWLIDIFLISSATRKYNSKKILEATAY